MIYDLLSSSPHAHGYSDVCIVGAGAAGISLAIELSRAGKRVTLIDGGGPDVEERAQEPYLGETSGLEHRGLHNGRFRAFGGTTTRWGGQILELDDLDFKQRLWITESGWPISKLDLDPFYKCALQMEGLRDALSDDHSVWQALWEKEASFSGMSAYLSRWCPEPNFAKLHHETIQSSTNVDLWLHANAVELVLEGSNAVALRARTQAGKDVLFAAREFIFCMGAIESSRFFLQPREGGLPWNQSGLLGHNFQDHIDCNAAVFVPEDLGEFRRCFDGIFYKSLKYQPRLRLDREKQCELQTLNVGSSFAYEHVDIEQAWRVRATAQDLMKRRFSTIDPSDLRHLLSNAGFAAKQGIRYALRKRSYQPTDAVISLRVHCEQEPTSQSRIELSTERDSIDLFRSRLNWQISRFELDSIRAYVTTAKESLAKLGEVVPLDGIDDDAVLTSACQDSFHHMGGMRMHDSPRRGVVDSNLKLHGVQNTWICSSAVFPTSGSSNPTHTLIALAMRLAAHLSRPAGVEVLDAANEKSAKESPVLAGSPAV